MVLLMHVSVLTCDKLKNEGTRRTIAWNLENKTCLILIPQSVSRDFIGSAGIWKHLKCNSIVLFFHCTEF